MDAIIVQFLVGLFFIMTDLPAMVNQPRARATIIRFVAAVVLVVLAYLRISIIR